jgi:hypothetical protein
MVDEATHRGRPWRVHDLARDFQLLDAWRIPIAADPARGHTFEDFYRVFLRNGVATDSRSANALFRLRLALGRILRLDAVAAPLPIPGCAETSVAARLTPADRAANRAATVSVRGQLAVAVPIYLFSDEALIEISNRTIHGLLHLGWVDAPAGKKEVELAIYIKSRGRMSDFYMALIQPFRYTVIYPAWIGRLCRAWERATTAA